MRMNAIAAAVFASLCTAISAESAEVVFEEAEYKGLLVHCDLASLRSVLALQNAGVSMDEALDAVNGGSMGTLCKRELVRFHTSRAVLPAELFGSPVEITPVRITGRFVDGLFVHVVPEQVRYSIFGIQSRDHYAEWAMPRARVIEAQVQTGFLPGFNRGEAFSCNTLEQLEAFLAYVQEGILAVDAVYAVNETYGDEEMTNPCGFLEMAFRSVRSVKKVYYNGDPSMIIEIPVYGLFARGELIALSFYPISVQYAVVPIGENW